MNLQNNQNVQDIIESIYPTFNIQDIAKKSGQRLVYFGTFSQCEKNKNHLWGDVVLKISQSEFNSHIAYLQKEIEILKTIQHPNYPIIFDAKAIAHDITTGEHLESIYFISIEERKNGVPLSECIENYAQETKVIQFLTSIIPILEVLWLHPKKIVHRDLKPENILISNDGVINIIDLGIIRETGSAGLTYTGSPIGPCTPLYASPEQAMNNKKDISFKSDIFSLGIIAYEMLSKNHPFKSDNQSLNSIQDILQRICADEPLNLHKTYGITPFLSNIIHKMLEKQPYKRFRTSTHLLRYLSQGE